MFNLELLLLCTYLYTMKTTIDIPNSELEDAIRFTNARTKREAVVSAIADFNRRMRMAKLVDYAGTWENLMTPEELQAQRRRR
ncbi:MAG: type II toxin-antitoxin system VapB family antitoxin [bacterium]|nr:type II toxin-antitoxin system VapB family antitoxin [bacterium]